MPETIPELVTVQDIMALGMSPIYSEAYLRALCGDGLTMLQVLAWDVPVSERVWVVAQLLPSRLRVAVCARFAERVMPIFEQKHLDDSRPRDCIATCRRWCRSDASDQELDSAGKAGADAARADRGQPVVSTIYAAWAASSAAWSIHPSYGADAAANAAKAARADAGYTVAAYAAECERQVSDGTR